MAKPRNTLSILAKLSLLILLIFACSGCTVLKTTMGVPFGSKEAKFKEGTTHYSTILHDLGTPIKVGDLPNGFVFLYEYIVTTEYQFGIALDFERSLNVSVNPDGEFDFRSLLRIGFGTGHADRQVLLMTFDESGILVAQRYNERKEDLGRGIGIQTFIGITSLVDSSHLTGDAIQHNWGMSLLRPIPRTLNVRQSLETGTSGLEQSGMPTKAGQHTLELRESDG